MEKALTYCEKCGAKNSVDPARQDAAICGSCKAPLAVYKEPLEGKDATFQKEVLESRMPVIVDFWAPWCMPCKMIAPVLHEIAAECQGKVKVVKINTDENPEVPSRYGIMSIPTLILFHGGEAVDKIVGAAPKKKIIQMLEDCHANL